MSSAGVALSSVREDATFSSLRFDGSRSPHCLEDSIVIYLSVSRSRMIPMRVLETESIASVKLRIQTFKGFVVKKQRLVFNGHELARNDCLVRDYGVGDGNVLHLVVRLSELRAITVKTICGKVFEFQVDRNENVGYVKQQIARREKGYGSLHDQKLICDGEELDDQRVIDDIGKNNDGVIHLLVHKSAKVRTKPIEKDLELSIEAQHDLDEKTGSKKIQITERLHQDRDFWIEPVVGNPKVVFPQAIKDLVSSAFAGLEKGKPPLRSTEGSGGAYLMQDVTGLKYVAVFKPIDEEPMAVNNPQGLPLSVDGEGLKRGTRVGEGALREVAAYLLDHPLSGRRSFSNDDIGFSGVPLTAMVRCLHEGFNHPGGFECSPKNFKIGSLQMFVSNHGSCEDMGPRSFPVEEVHKISVLDIRLANADRHGGNILVCREGEDGRIVLVPIDHGYCLPENFEDCTFEWLYWPQAREPYNSKTVEYIKSLDAEQDIALLKFHGWDLSIKCARTLRISTMLLKKGVERGFTPFTIGKVLCRENIRKESMIEEIVHEAKEAVLPGTSEMAFMQCVSEIMDRRLDELTP